MSFIEDYKIISDLKLRNLKFTYEWELKLLEKAHEFKMEELTIPEKIERKR